MCPARASRRERCATRLSWLSVQCPSCQHLHRMSGWTELRALKSFTSTLARRLSLGPFDSLQYSSVSCMTHLPQLIVLTIFVLFESSIFAQAPAGAIRGSITDATGAIVTNATVQVHQPQTGSNRVAQTDNVG